MSRVQTISFAGLLVVVAGVCLALGAWQLDRLAQRRATNVETERARSAPLVDLAKGHQGTLDQRRVMAAGRFDQERLFVLRGRPYRGSPGVELVMPLLLAGSDTAVLVNLGFVPAADAVHFDPAMVDLPISDSVVGLAQAIPLNPGWGQPVLSRGDTTWRHIEFEAVARRLPYPVLPIVIGRTTNDSIGGYPRALPAPPLDDGPHLSYAIQWFSFATIALVGGALWLRKRETDT
jgi:surfeit locus 1 family protein